MAEDAAAAGLTGALRTLLAALPARRRRQLWLLNLLTLANAAADTAMVAAAMLFLAAVAGQALPAALAGWLPDAGPDQRITQAALAFALAALGANLVRLLHLWLSEAYAAAVAHELTVEVQRRVLAQPYAFHARHHSSELLASLETAGALAFNLIRPLLQTFAAAATGAAILALLASLAPLPALAAVVILAGFYLAVARLAARRLAANSDEAGQACVKLYVVGANLPNVAQRELGIGQLFLSRHWTAMAAARAAMNFALRYRRAVSTETATPLALVSLEQASGVH